MKDWADLAVGDVIVEKEHPFRVYAVVGAEGEGNTFLNLTSGAAHLVDSFRTFPTVFRLWELYDVLEAGE